MSAIVETRTHRTTSCFSLFLIAYLLPVLCALSPSLSAVDDVAQERANTIWNMDNHIGLTFNELLAACRFIEKIEHDTKSSKRVFSSKTTKLPCVIERISSPKGFLIKNLPLKIRTIGRGAHKQVKKEIFYGKLPKIVANCMSDESGAHEICVLKKLKHCPGIVPFLGSSALEGGRYSIRLEYFPGGTLGRRLKNSYHFSNIQMVKIAKDCARGLKSMHAHNLVHRDLHSGNILLRSTPSGLFEAALVDFGKTLEVRQAGDSDVPQATKTRCPPEALLIPFSKLNRYLVDVYALGCDFYLMRWKHPVPWSLVYNVFALHTYGLLCRERMHAHIAALYKKDKQKKVGDLLAKKRKGRALSPDEEFQILIFQMIDSEPRFRPSISKVEHRLEQLAPAI